MRMFRPLTLLVASVSAFVAPTLHTSTTFTRHVARMGIAQSTTATTTSTTQRNMSSSSAMTAATEFAKQEIEQNKIVIFSKSYCPHCTKAKDLFAGLKVDGTKIYELDKMDNGNDVQAALLEMTGQRTVPNIFVNKEHLGGNDDTQAAFRSGKLQKMIDGTA
jgi:glutaredoxin 3